MGILTALFDSFASY